MVVEELSRIFRVLICRPRSVLSISLASLGCLLLPGPALAGDEFYVGVDAGANWLVHMSSGSDTAGANFGGELKDIDGDADVLFGLNAGYRYSDLWRFGLSYIHMENDQSWTGLFPSGSTTAFAGDSQSDLFFIDAYLHARGLNEILFEWIDPFVGLGLGLSYNQLSDVEETLGTTHVSDIDDGSVLHPAVRLGMGVDADVTQSLTLTTAFDAYWLGGFKTGDRRETAVGTQNIGAWKTDEAITLALKFGIRYNF